MVLFSPISFVQWIALFCRTKSHGMDNENLQTPSTSGPIPKEIEQQQQQQHKVIVQLGPTTRSLAVKKLSESTNEEIVGEGNAESQIEHDIHGDVVDEHEAEVIPCCSETLLPEDDPKQLQRKNQVWSSSETNRFYQGLKEVRRSCLYPIICEFSFFSMERTLNR